MKAFSKENYDINAIKNRYAIISTAISAVAPSLKRENNTHNQDLINTSILEKFNDYTK